MNHGSMTTRAPTCLLFRFQVAFHDYGPACLQVTRSRSMIHLSCESEPHNVGRKGGTRSRCGEGGRHRIPVPSAALPELCVDITAHRPMNDRAR